MLENDSAARMLIYVSLAFLSPLNEYAKNFGFDFIVNKSLSCHSNHGLTIWLFYRFCHFSFVTDGTNKFMLFSPLA